MKGFYKARSDVQGWLKYVGPMPWDGEEGFCCAEMRDAWDGRFIGFGDFDGEGITEPEMCIYTCQPYPEGAAWEEMAISCCPFCGEAIELEDVTHQTSSTTTVRS